MKKKLKLSGLLLSFVVLCLLCIYFIYNNTAIKQKSSNRDAMSVSSVVSLDDKAIDNKSADIKTDISRYENSVFDIDVDFDDTEVVLYDSDVCETQEEQIDIIDDTVIDNIIEDDLFVIPEGTYNYCPSAIVSGDNISVFYCSNVTSYQIADNICYSDAIFNSDGSISFKNRSVVLSPTIGSWDSVHVCDPSVISGNFLYQGATYKYLMAYLGCDTTDNQKNQIGLAVSNALSYGWIKVGSSPIVMHNYDSSYSVFQWGVGQPSLINLDDNGHVLLFYTEGTYNLTCTKVQEWNFSDLDNPEMMSSSIISNSGTNDFISNADFALSGDMLYMICDTHPFGGSVLNCVPDASCVYCCSWNGVVESLGSVTWNKIYTINSDNTGFIKNHNCCLYRTCYGGLSSDGVVYTSASEGSDFLSSLCTYRLQHIEW